MGSATCLECADDRWQDLTGGVVVLSLLGSEAGTVSLRPIGPVP